MSCRVTTKTTSHLIKCVTRVILGLSGLTQSSPVYYSCYMSQLEFDTKN